jgi:branched-chain amino acid transport system substrate-binding protein
VHHPLNTQDFSSFVIQDEASKAKVVALANAGGDTQNAIKQAYEFGLQRQGQKLLALLLNITDVHTLGIQAAQGMIATEGFWIWMMQAEPFPSGFSRKPIICRR